MGVSHSAWSYLANLARRCDRVAVNLSRFELLVLRFIKLWLGVNFFLGWEMKDAEQLHKEVSRAISSKTEYREVVEK